MYSISNGIVRFFVFFAGSEVSGLVSALDFFHQVEGFILTLDSTDTILVDGKTIHVVPSYEFDFSR